VESESEIIKRGVWYALLMSFYIVVHFFALLKIDSHSTGDLLWDAVVIGIWLYASHVLIIRLREYAALRKWSVDKAIAVIVATQPIFASVAVVMILLQPGTSGWLSLLLSVRGGWWLHKFLKAY
jgi:hypothetical protein